MEEIKRGGKRSNAGRKPTSNPKETIAIFVERSNILKFGSKDKLKVKLYEFISNYQNYDNPISELKNMAQTDIKKFDVAPINLEPVSFVTGLPPKLASLFDGFVVRIKATRSKDELTEVMNDVKSEPMLPKEKKELKAIADKHSSENLYTD